MTALQISKSDFLDFRSCAKGWWLKRRKPDVVSWPAPSAFDRMLMKDGYAVEAEAKRLVATWPHHASCSFQREFSAGQLFARADLVHDHGDGSIDIYEIKGSTSLKSSGGQDHVDDGGFQLLVAELSGTPVRAVRIVHVNGEYSRQGDIDPAKLLVIVDVTAEVRERADALRAEIEQAVALLNSHAIDETGCTCRQLGSIANRCATFAYFNPDIPGISAHLLPRISKMRLAKLDEEGRLAIDLVTEADITGAQAPVWKALASGEPVINLDGIRTFCAQLKWPLHFYDYETFASAVPLADGHRPQQAMPVQFSLHRLHEDGAIEHFEYLAGRPGQQAELIDALRDVCAVEGTAIAWNKSYEMSCNRRMAELVPSAAPFLDSLNERTIDLMDPFKSDYVHARFEGSTSIKKVLPVLCPHLQYDKSAVHDGAGAMEAWITMVLTRGAEERSRLQRELKNYCKLDSLAMVEIFQFLRTLR
jgi:hypothetical protein